MNTPSLNDINKIANMDPNLITKYYKVKTMNDFMNVKYQNPRLKQSEIASQLKRSTSSIQRQRNDINMNSPFRINPNIVKKRQKKAKIDENGDLNRPQMTSKDLKTTSKTKMRGGFLQDNIEINEHYLNKILENNNS